MQLYFVITVSIETSCHTYVYNLIQNRVSL